MFKSIIHFYKFIWAMVFYPKLKPTIGVFQGEVGYDPKTYETWQYTPVKDAPLSYTTADGYTITPQTMITDGASVPRWLKWFGREELTSNYFLRPALIHDWLYTANEFQTPVVIGTKPDGSPLYNHEMTFTTANLIFAEGIRRDMIDKNRPVNEEIIKAFFQAVQKFGKEAWDSIGFGLYEYKLKMLKEKQSL